MRVVYTDEALRDLDEALEFIASNYPGILGPFRARLRAIERRIGRWPKSAEEVRQRAGVYAVPLIRYPYKLFYRLGNGVVEILHLQHGKRR